MYFFSFNASLGGYETQMLPGLDTDKSSRDHSFLHLQFLKMARWYDVTALKWFLMFAEQGWQTADDKRAGRPLYKVMAQNVRLRLLREASREGGRHMFPTSCQARDETSPVAGYTSKNKSYGCCLKREETQSPFTNRLQIRTAKSNRWKAGAEPRTYEAVKWRAVFKLTYQGWVFFHLVNVNSVRLSTSRRLWSNIRCSKRRIKVGFESR